MEKAVSLDHKYPIHFYELDQLYEAAGTPPEKRLAILESNQGVVEQRDDALSREVALKVVMGKYDGAIDLMTGREYEVWEGGSLNVADFWTDAHLLRGHQNMEAKRYQEALADYRKAFEIPSNLPSERGSGARKAEAAYWIGNAYEALGDQAKAKQSWQDSAAAEFGRSRRGRERNAASGQGVQLYYQALALRKLGENDKAQTIFRSLVTDGMAAIGERSSQLDLSASMDEQNSQRASLAMAHYVAGLGYLGLGETGTARNHLNEALKVSPAHVGARTSLAMMD
jgi:tetratricopeptide (TPR) repeat protein